jgi:hypothetical protein
VKKTLKMKMAADMMERNRAKMMMSKGKMSKWRRKVKMRKRVRGKN